MKFALVNPPWTFEGSIYFGCREPHLPLEYGYATMVLERDGHDVLLVDGHAEGLSDAQIRERVQVFHPDFTIVTTAPTYLFWRCAPPELTVPQRTLQSLRGGGGILVAVGPHGSVTPRTALQKLGVDLLIRGEFETVLPDLAAKEPKDWGTLPSVCLALNNRAQAHFGIPHITDMTALPALVWPLDAILKHSHHHHRFDGVPAEGPGAEMETSRGCPYQCSFCAKESFRGPYRKRPLALVLEELDGLLAQGVRYVYFIDEIFLPDAELLEALAARDIQFGVQMRIDLWSHEMLQSLGKAGCVSVEAGVESITETGRRQLNKQGRLPFEEIMARLIAARKHIPFVQANLIATEADDAEAIQSWRAAMLRHGVWANEPVPMFPYPGSPLYRQKWGTPDDWAWERAHEYYLKTYAGFSDIQDQRPLSLAELESGCSP